ncbi:hypothetical protein SAY86_021562 [Trapa natans]|uniref:Uncharacterized protein n=1 Tax=Trapa natans TaxID=22666 RepID=A0AAN7M889_TRANT|nr:hypothetical protein SAY86_021562 [Trapa natans]
MGREFMDGQKEDEEKGSEKAVQVCAEPPKSSMRETLRRVHSDQTFAQNVQRQQGNRICNVQRQQGNRICNVQRQQGNRICMNTALYRIFRGLDCRIPKDMVSPDEKYLRHCLELIHNSVSKAASLNVPLNSNSSIAGMPCDSLHLLNKIGILESPDCSAQLVFDCSLASGMGKVVTTSVRQRIEGSMMESKSMINLMRNPVFHRSCTLDGDFGMSNSHDLQEFPSHVVASPPSQLSLCSLSTQGIGMPVPSALSNNEIDPRDRKLLSRTSTNSTSTGTDKSSSSTSAPDVSLGMLHITWRSGIPHFVFSIDGKTEIYVTSLTDAEPTNSCSTRNQLYLFYLRPQGQKNVVHDMDPCPIVGRMKVTTSLSLSFNNLKVVESEFVLSTSCEASSDVTQASVNNLRRSKGLPKKMIELFKNSHLPRQSCMSQVDGTTNHELESSFLETPGDAHSNLDALCSNKKLRSYAPSNFELAAVLVRAPFRDSERQVETGGWGLKFLKKVATRIPRSLDETLPYDATRNTGNCSTSFNVIIPDGIHGGPRTSIGGPSTLTERWKNGGQCDCGGWDLGCPLNVLSPRSNQEKILSQEDMQRNNQEEVLSQEDMQGTMKSLNLYLQGKPPGLRKKVMPAVLSRESPMAVKDGVRMHFEVCS